MERILTDDARARHYRPSRPLDAWRNSSGTPNLWQFFADVEAMLAHPRVEIALNYYKAGIANPEFEVTASSDDVKRFVEGELERFWMRSRLQAQQTYHYGRGGYEVCYEHERGVLRFHHLEDFHPLDCRVLTRDGNYVGFKVQGLGALGSDDHPGFWGPHRIPAKGFWFTHKRRYHRYYGRSQLYASWRPWRRLACPDGGEDIVDGAAYLNGIKPRVGRFPVEDNEPREGHYGNGQPLSNRDKMLEMLETIKSGGNISISSRTDPQTGKYLWDVEFPDHTLDLSNLLAYCDNLEDAISLGCDVPPELLEASEVGSGYSGRAIPMEGFYVGQQHNAEWLVWEWGWQIGTPLVLWNFGPEAWYEVKVLPLLETKLKQGRPQQQPGQQQPGGAQDSQWRQDPGPNANPRRWVNTQTGRVEYGDRSPGESANTGARFAHAPKGGVTIGGKKFEGGEFIPGDVLAQATSEEKAAIGDTPEGQTDPALVSKHPHPGKKDLPAGKELENAPKTYVSGSRSGQTTTRLDGAVRVKTDRGDVFVKPNAPYLAAVESATSDFAALAGVRVPATSADVVGGKSVSVSELVPTKPGKAIDRLKQAPHEEVVRHLLFDAVAGVGDRGYPNFLLTPDNHLVSVDHAISLDTDERPFEIEAGEHQNDLVNALPPGTVIPQKELARMADAGEKMVAHLESLKGEFARLPPDRAQYPQRLQALKKRVAVMRNLADRGNATLEKIVAAYTKPTGQTRFATEVREAAAADVLAQVAQALAPLADDVRAELLAALEGGSPEAAYAAIRALLAHHRPELERLLEGATLAAALAGARQVAAGLPALPPLPEGDAPAGLSPAQAAGLLDLLRREDREGLLAAMSPEVSGWARARLSTPGGLLPPDDASPWTVGPGDHVEFPMIREAADDLRKKRLLTRQDFDALTSAAKREAFTIAGVQEQAVLQKVHDALVDAVEHGGTPASFKARVEEDVGADTFLSDAHRETVYRTTVQQAYSAGKDAVLDNPVVGEAFPYEETLPIRDSRLTELCATVSRSGIQGTGIFRRDDPVYQMLKAPRHFNCRCGRNPLTVEQAAARGIHEAQEWGLSGKPPENPTHVPMPAIELPRGWQRFSLLLGR